MCRGPPKWTLLLHATRPKRISFAPETHRGRRTQGVTAYACNKSGDLGIAWALPWHQKARAIATKPSTSSAVVANEVTRRTSLASRANATPLGRASVVHG